MRAEWIADECGQAPEYVAGILNGIARILPSDAEAFERVLGIPASFWLNLQKAYDKAKAKERPTAKAKIPKEKP